MAAIFPPLNRGGVPPGPGVCNAYSPTHPTIGEGPLYVAPDCTTVLTDCQLNALVSEILAAVDELGFPYNTSSITNLGDALRERLTLLQGEFGDMVKRSGDTMTGELLLPCPPTNDNAASCKLFVEETAQARADACCAHMQTQLDNVEAKLQGDIDNRVRRDGDQMSGPLILSGDPTDISNPGQAATKNYVDVRFSRIYVQPTAPVNMLNDTLWWDSSIGALYLRFEGEWVQVAPPLEEGPPGGGGVPGPSGNWLPLIGGTLSGPLFLHGPPTQPLEATTRQWVLDQISAGGTFIDANADGRMYARKDHDWHEIMGPVDDAPHDGEVWGRSDGNWVPITVTTDGGYF